MMTCKRGSLPRVIKLAPLEMGGRILDLWLCHQPLLPPESPSPEEPLPSYCSGEQRFPTWNLNSADSADPEISEVAGAHESLGL